MFFLEDKRKKSALAEDTLSLKRKNNIQELYFSHNVLAGKEREKNSVNLVEL